MPDESEREEMGSAPSEPVLDAGQLVAQGEAKAGEPASSAEPSSPGPQPPAFETPLTSQPADKAMREAALPTAEGDSGEVPPGGESEAPSLSPPQPGTPPGGDRPRRKILIGSQRDPAQYRRRPLGEGVRLVGIRPPRPPREGGHREHSRLGEKEGETDRTSQIAEVSPPADVPPSTPPEVPAWARSPLAEAGGVVSDQAQAVARPGSAGPAEQRELALAAGAEPPAEAPAQGFGEREKSPGMTSPAISPSVDSAVVPAGVEQPVAEDSSPVASSSPPEGSMTTPEAIMWEAISETLPPLQGLPPGVGPEPSAETAPFPPPKARGKLPAELESELEAALAGFSMEEALQLAGKVPGERLAEDTLVDAKVVGIHEEKVFVDLGVREQGFLALKETDTPPELGSTLQVRIVRFDPENSVYEVALPVRAADIAAWEELVPGTLVEARVTGVNAGGLECEVGHIRGFIPMSQIALYRVTNPEEYVGQRLTCVVVEASRERRNLVLSRRAAIEREQQAAREALWASLEPGQVYEGLVRKIMDFGAFVDIGGADGLLHISQMSWGRINHPSEVLQEGQRIKVKVLAVDRASRRISLAYRDLVGDPWETVESKYPPNSVVHGKVTRLMPYGAFVELEPGVEGLVHISELAWKKVWRVSDVVHEGQEVDVVVLSVDKQARRISLSMKHLTPPPDEAEKPPVSGEEPAPEVKTETLVEITSAAAVEEAEAEKASGPAPEGEAEGTPAEKEQKKKPKPERPLRGGLGPSPSANKFGLRW